MKLCRISLYDSDGKFVGQTAMMAFDDATRSLARSHSGRTSGHVEITEAHTRKTLARYKNGQRIEEDENPQADSRDV